MFKPSPRMLGRLRRLPLTTKQTNKGYYKGTGTGLLGSIDRKGRFQVDLNKVRTFVVPRDLEVTELTPFIARRSTTNAMIGQDTWEKPIEHIDGQMYLEDWIQRGNKEEHLQIQEDQYRMQQAQEQEERRQQELREATEAQFFREDVVREEEARVLEKEEVRR